MFINPNNGGILKAIPMSWGRKADTKSASEKMHDKHFLQAPLDESEDMLEKFVCPPETAT